MSSASDGPPGTFLNYRAVAQAAMAAQQHDLQPAACRYLLEVVAGYTNGHPAFPSYEALARRTGLSVRAVRLYAKALVDQGYLALSRRPNPHGGWGQPEWQLGATCLQVEVAPGSHSTGNGLPLASGNGLPQKRSKSPRTVGRPPLVALMGGMPEETHEENPPQPPKGQKVADVCDAVKAVTGRSPRVSGRDAGAINKTDATPQEIATAYVKVARGEWKPNGRSIADGNLSFWFVIERINAILTAPGRAAVANLLD